MFNIIISLIKTRFVIVASLLLFTACSTVSQKQVISSPQESSSQPDASVHINTMIQKMDADKNPKSHIGSIRMYALDNFSNLTNEELMLIQKTNPKIYNNNNTLEYCFVWTLPNNGGCLEVVATPPPSCMPIAVFRRDRVYFP